MIIALAKDRSDITAYADIQVYNGLSLMTQANTLRCI